jgi:hypothetical protein
MTESQVKIRQKIGRRTQESVVLLTVIAVTTDFLSQPCSSIESHLLHYLKPLFEHHPDSLRLPNFKLHQGQARTMIIS